MSSYVGRGGGPAPNESLVKACLSGALGKVLEAAKDKWGDAVSSTVGRLTLMACCRV